jgi:hypothetical protein
MGTDVINSSINKTSNIIYNAIQESISNASSSTNCQNNLVQINTEEAVKSFNSESSQTTINNNINSVSKEISNETGEDVNKVKGLVTGITNSMSNAYINTCNNTKDIRNLAQCPSSNKFMIDGTTKSDYFNAVKTCMLEQESVGRAELRMAENLVTSEFGKGLNGYAWWIVIFIAAALLTIIFMMVFGIIFVFVFYKPFLALTFILLPSFIVFLLLSIGYFPTWWPYQKLNNVTSSKENDEKRRNNLIRFIIFGVITLILLALIILFLFLGIREKKKSVVQKVWHRFENWENPIQVPKKPLPPNKPLPSSSSSLSSLPTSSLPDASNLVSTVPPNKPLPQSTSFENYSEKRLQPPYLEAEREQELLMSGVVKPSEDLHSEKSNLAESALQSPYPSTFYRNVS